MEAQPQQHGIKETKEAVLGAIVMGFYLVKLAKDGIDMNDLSAFFDKLKNDEKFVAIMKDAYQGAEKIPVELGDVTMAEVIELGIDVMPLILKELKEWN